jgi:hypothetical protein
LLIEDPPDLATEHVEDLARDPSGSLISSRYPNAAVDQIVAFFVDLVEGSFVSLFTDLIADDFSVSAHGRP